MKQLYFLHIPKTAGKHVSKCIKKSLDENNLKYYISTHFPNYNNFEDKVYVSIHAGTYPILKNPNMDVATIIRNPVEARLSYFNFIYNMYLVDREEYSSIKNVKDKLSYYLFEDKNYSLHNNYQARFICNPADERSFDVPQFYKEHGFEMLKEFNEGKAFTWFVENEKTSYSFAVQQITKFKIKNTLDSFEKFENNINKWFMENYKIEINFEKNIKTNESVCDYGDGKLYKTQDLMSLLSNDDIAQIIENNQIDYNLYKLIKDIENA
jgi:hypothetical protein